MIYMREWRHGAYEKEVLFSGFLPALNHFIPPRCSNTKKKTAQSYPENVTLPRVIPNQR